MPLPFLIPVIVALTSAGLGAGGVGIAKHNRASGLIEKAKTTHQHHIASYHQACEITARHLADYGELKVTLDQGNLQQLRDYITANGHTVEATVLEHLEAIDMPLPDLTDPETTAALEGLISGALKSVAVGTGVRSGVLTLVGAFGTASTGTPIAALHGVAVTNASLAALGGGSLATGGGGVALGGALLGGATLAPAVLIAGLALLSKGEKSMTTARDYAARAAVANADLDARIAYQPAVHIRIAELTDAAHQLDRNLEQVLDVLDSLPLERSSLPTFQRAMLLATSLVELLKLPVLNHDGSINPDTRSYTASNTEGVPA